MSCMCQQRSRVLYIAYLILCKLNLFSSFNDALMDSVD